MRGAAINVQAMERPRLFGVLGDPVDHSLSPAMQNAAFAATRLPHLYLRYRVPARELRTAFAEARRGGFGGMNLTVPLKEAALPLVDELTSEAASMQAVNTVTLRGGRLIGDNTDGRGFVAALGSRVRLDRAPVLMLGAGGSARAVGTALARAGCPRLTIVNRTVARAERLANDLGGGIPRLAVAPLSEVARHLTDDIAVVVNTTSTGLGGDAVRLDPRRSRPPCLFVDLVYGARHTPFLAAARRAGRPTLDGGLMLLHQGALAFAAWTGRTPPLRAMATALRSAGLALPEPIAGGRQRA
jgi:shikimate dehydrogenase